jgi:hypothetical protein
MQEFRIGPRPGRLGKTAVVRAADDDAQAALCRRQDAALKEIAAIAESALWFEGPNQIYTTIRRVARAARGKK